MNEDDIDQLSVLGQRDRLLEPGIALCGSRAAGNVGIELATTVGRYAAEAKLNLVSGYAKGIDMAGHVACVGAGGQTVAVLAEGLSQFRLRPQLRAAMDLWDEGDLPRHLTVVSEFEDEARWTVWRAMQRNALICKLGKVLVAIDPGESGGTLDAVKKAVKQELPVVVGWSDPERSYGHLVPLIDSGAVTLVMSEGDLLESIDAALEAREFVPTISQPRLL